MAHKTDRSHKSSRVVLGDRGRLVLPAGVRRELGLIKGSKLSLTTEADGSMVLRPYAAIAEASMGMLAHIAPPGVSLVDELIAERRLEAEREDEKFKRLEEGGDVRG